MGIPGEESGEVISRCSRSICRNIKEQMKEEASPLTGIPVQISTDAFHALKYYVDPICGPYSLGSSHVFGSLSLGKKRKIAKVLATRTLRIGEIATVLTDTTTVARGSCQLVPISSLLSQYPTDVVAVLDEALVNLSKMIEFPSDKIEIGNRERWLIYAHDHDSEEYMLRQLLDSGFIKHAGSRSGGAYMVNIVTIEAKGWDRLRNLREDGSQSDQVFVAMWFANEMQSVFDAAIGPAISDAGLRPLRIDLKEHNNKICDEIIGEIRRSRFVVADFTGNRGGVYYEAGFAHGLGKQVIWTVHEDHLNDVHFDTRQYNHITYTTPEELREKLFNRIRATQQ